MLKKLISGCLLLLSLTCSNINNDRKKIVGERFIEEEKIDTFYFPFNDHDKIGSIKLKSSLRAKVSELENISSIYRLAKFGEITKKSSIVFNAILNKSELYDQNKNFYKVNDMANFEASIYEINYARIEINRGKNKPVSKSVIEELVFYSEEDCKSLFSYINNVRRKEYFWNSIDEFRSEIFIEKNKFYFVSMTNQHHAGRAKIKIARLIKE